MPVSLPPLIDKESRVIILGTMPSEISLERNEYYANPRNQFWKIIYGIYNQTPSDDYEEKCSFLLSRKISLWDVLYSCEREGSSDSRIRNPASNDFINLFNNYPDIKAVFFNGEKAETLFNRLVKNNLNRFFFYHRLPSSSSANTKMTFDGKIEEWKIVKQYIVRPMCS